MTQTFRLAGLIALITSPLLAQSQVAQYSLIELGFLPGYTFSSEASAINDRGQIVGVSVSEETDFYTGAFHHAFLWEHGALFDLGTLGGPDAAPSDINNRGQVVGVSYAADCRLVPPGQCPRHAFLWEGGTMTDLGVLGGDFSYALGINNRGQIVGVSTTSVFGQLHAFLWDTGTMTDLGEILPGDSQGVAINNRGQIVIDLVPYDIPGNRAFIWEKGALFELLAPGLFNLRASDVNDRGQIVGEARPFGQPSLPLIWENRVARVLPLPPGTSLERASGINGVGEAVGSIYGPGADVLAVLWRNGSVVELPTLSPIPGKPPRAVALDINNGGQIVGISEGRAVLWCRTCN